MRTIILLVSAQQDDIGRILHDLNPDLPENVRFSAMDRFGLIPFENISSLDVWSEIKQIVHMILADPSAM